MRLFCFGLGYSAEALARRLSARTGALAGTRTSVGQEPAPLGAKLAPFKGDVASAEVRTLLAGATHVLVSIPPDIEGDVVLRLFRDALAAMPELAWVGYLSTVGVYGDAGGRGSTRRARCGRRRSAVCGACRRSVRGWRSARRRGGASRSSGSRASTGPAAASSIRCARGRRGASSSRARCSTASTSTMSPACVAAAIDRPTRHRVYNVSDDEPAPPQDVVAYAAELLGLPVPPEIAFEAAGLGGMAATFWAECKRVDNARIKTELGAELLYPTYREGLQALAATRAATGAV